MLDTATHVAGPVVKIRDRLVQRCCVCGEKLGDSDDEERAVFWCEGEIVRVNKHDFLESTGTEFLGVKKLPKDFCLGLVEP